MSLAELFYAKHPRRLLPFRRRSATPRGRKKLFESLEPRLLLSGSPLEPVLFIPGFGGTLAQDTSSAGLNDWLTTRGIAPTNLALEPLGHNYDDIVQTLENVGYQ